jgi:hypothetical protein
LAFCRERIRRHVISATSADRFPSWSIEERALVLSCAIVLAVFRLEKACGRPLCLGVVNEG